MNFRDLFEKYINNTATEDERLEIEQEIEKSKLINEYLDTSLDIECRINTNIDEESAVELKNIRKDVKRKKRNIIMSSVAVVISILAVFQFVAAPLLNNYYYDPNKNTYSEFANDFEVGLATYTELHFPGQITSSVMVNNTGIGKYSLSIRQHNTFTNKTEYTYGNITRGRLTVDANFWHMPVLNGFAYSTYPFYPPQEKDTKDTIEKSAQLPSYVNLRAYISFNRDLSMEEIADILKKSYGAGLYISWVGVRNSSKDIQSLPLIGFEPTGSGPVFSEINKKYPYYEIDEYTINKDKIKAEVLENHFKDLLKFQIDNTDFSNMLDKVSNSEEYYKSVLDYVNKNGVKTYGFLVQGNAESILELTKMKDFCGVYIDDMKVSLP